MTNFLFFANEKTISEEECLKTYGDHKWIFYSNKTTPMQYTRYSPCFKGSATRFRICARCRREEKEEVSKFEGTAWIQVQGKEEEKSGKA